MKKFLSFFFKKQFNIFIFNDFIESECNTLTLPKNKIVPVNDIVACNQKIFDELKKLKSKIKNANDFKFIYFPMSAKSVNDVSISFSKDYEVISRSKLQYNTVYVYKHDMRCDVESNFFSKDKMIVSDFVMGWFSLI